LSLECRSDFAGGREWLRLKGDNIVNEKILVVDDDATLIRFVSEYFENEGYAMYTANRGETAIRVFYEARPDIVILDVMMPGMDGWEVCARLREMADVPIVMLTAKTSEADKLRGFRLGVDDFVTKPFSLAELAARVGAILSRAKSQSPKSETRYIAGPISVDMTKREVIMNDTVIDLTPTEFRLLSLLASKTGEAVSQEELVSQVWGDQRTRSGSVLRRYIWLLRKKIEPDPENPRHLLTVRGYGYRLERG
jgi:DNA-binding response OmpR family regulator